ncbi:hypothetical protein HZP42_10330 [Elizabethkingia anophelis]|nr:hypothetical protein [Elizabethkingia anophelis]
MFTDEFQVGRRAEQMLETSLRSKVSSFADHINRNEGDDSIKDATAKATVKRYGNRRSGNQKMYLTKLSIKMGQHGFIQHFGVDTTREGGTRTRNIPRVTTYSFRSHFFRIQAKPFINQSVEESNVVDFVLQNLTRLRSEELFVEVKRIIEN